MSAETVGDWAFALIGVCLVGLLAVCVAALAAFFIQELRRR